MNLLTGVKKSRVAEKTSGSVGDKQLQRAVVETQVAALTEDDDVEQARSVFVKNLNFSTSEVSLKQHFQQKITQGAVRSMTVSLLILITHGSVAVYFYLKYINDRNFFGLFSEEMVFYKQWFPTVGDEYHY